VDKMTLYLNGGFFEDVQIKLPHYDPDLSFEENVEIRKAYVDHKAKTFKIMRTKQLLKCQDNFQIHITLQSRLNEMNLSDEEINSIKYEPDQYSRSKSGPKRA